MKKITWLVGAVVVAAALFCSQAEAAPITFYSGDGTMNETVNGGAVVTITPHPVWGDVSESAGLLAGTAEWISYADTGYDNPIFAPNAVSRAIGDQTALYSRTFELFDVGKFSLWVLTDDTATVQLLGPGGSVNELFTAFPGQVDPCAPGGTGVPIGCLQADIGFNSVSNLAAGLYTLNLYAFQTNGNVFGSQYAGKIESVPEPGTLILLGISAVGFAASRRRLRGSSVS